MDGFCIGSNTEYSQGLSSPMLTKTQEKDLTNFLSIELGSRARYKSKQLSKALQRRQDRKIMRNRVMKLMKPLLRDRRLLRKITALLERSGLSLAEQKTLAKRIQKLLLDFSKGVHNELDLTGIKLQRLPISLRRFIIALQVLKAEIVHLFRLRMERDRKRIEFENAPRLTIEERKIEPQLTTDFREIYSTGVSKTLGSYAGMMNIKHGRYYAQEDKNTTKYSVKTSKQTRNCQSNKTKTYQKYRTYKHAQQNKNAKTNKNNYYQTNVGKNF